MVKTMRDKLFLILRDMGVKAFTLADKADYLLANDVVPVVKCKNCIHGEYDKTIDEYYCKMTYCCEKENHFCSYGERK